LVETGRHRFVAQIFNVPYRRFPAGKAPSVPKPVQIGPRPAGYKPAVQQIPELRYGASDYYDFQSWLAALTRW
jgi:hypothetical protein